MLSAEVQQIEAKKKIVAGFQKERLLLERKLKKRKAEAEKKARHLTMHCCQDHSRFACAVTVSDEKVTSLLKEGAVKIGLFKYMAVKAGPARLPLKGYPYGYVLQKANCTQSCGMPHN